MLNLVLNARDAMPDGGRLAIETRAATDEEMAALEPPLRNDAYAAITVTDSGRGMDAVTLSQAFEPFFSTKETGSGTGLGLASVYGLTRQNGGHVSANSTVGDGTTVTVLFPLSEGVPPATSGAPVTDEHRDASILVAEDSDQIRSLILERAGYSVHLAQHGEEALSLASTGVAIDLPVADVRMPLVGGAELAARLRRDRPDLCVLYISGHPFDQLDLPALDPQREAYLAKPFTPTVLIEEVRARLAGRDGDERHCSSSKSA